MIAAVRRAGPPRFYRTAAKVSLRRRRQEERELETEVQGGKVEMATEELEEAIKQALNTEAE